MLVAGCGGGTQSAAAPGAASPVKVTQVLPAQQLLILEVRGSAPVDTSVAITPGEARLVIVRHAAPDNNVFAELAFAASVFAADSGQEPIVVTIKARPGVYGLTVGCDHKFGQGARLTFKYPVHFQAPAPALARYGSAQGYERALMVAIEQDGGNFGLLESTRPSTDNLSAPMPRPGTYLVAAPQ